MHDGKTEQRRATLREPSGKPQGSTGERTRRNPRNDPWGTQGTREEDGRKKDQETRAEPRRELEEQRRNKGRRIRAGAPYGPRTKRRDEAQEHHILLYPGLSLIPCVTYACEHSGVSGATTTTLNSTYISGALYVSCFYFY